MTPASPTTTTSTAAPTAGTAPTAATTNNGGTTALPTTTTPTAGTTSNAGTPSGDERGKQLEAYRRRLEELSREKESMPLDQAVAAADANLAAAKMRMKLLETRAKKTHDVSSWVAEKFNVPEEEEQPAPKRRRSTRYFDDDDDAPAPAPEATPRTKRGAVRSQVEAPVPQPPRPQPPRPQAPRPVVLSPRPPVPAPGVLPVSTLVVRPPRPPRQTHHRSLVVPSQENKLDKLDNLIDVRAELAAAASALDTFESVSLVLALTLSPQASHGPRRAQVSFSCVLVTFVTGGIAVARRDAQNQSNIAHDARRRLNTLAGSSVLVVSRLDSCV